MHSTLTEEERVHDDESNEWASETDEKSDHEEIDSLYSPPRPEQPMSPADWEAFKRAAESTTIKHQSTSSSATQAPNRQSSDAWNIEYLRNELGFLVAKPAPALDSPITLDRISAVFHHQDRLQQGWISRGEVTKLCNDLLKDHHTEFGPDEIQGMIRSFEINSVEAGSFNEGEFITFMQQLGQNIADERKEKLARNMRNAQQQASDRRMVDSKFILPWGWSRTLETPILFFDAVRKVEVKNPPRLLRDTAFSVMALEADICMYKLDMIKAQWAYFVPQSLERTLVALLEVVRTEASKFTIFEHRDNPVLLSDLDAALSAYELASELLDEEESRNFQTATFELTLAADDGHQILSLIQVFAFCLQEISHRESLPSPGGLSNFWAQWDRYDIDTIYENILEIAPKWHRIKEAVSTSRKLMIDATLESRALAVVEGHMCAAEEKKANMLSQSWKGFLTQASITEWKAPGSPIRNMRRWLSTDSKDPSDVFLRIKVDHPSQTFETKIQKRGDKMLWDQVFPVLLLPSSEFYVTLVTQVGKSEQDVTSFKPQAHKLDFNAREKSLRNNTLESRTLSFEGPCTLELYLVMENNQELKAELLKLDEWLRPELPE